MKHKAAYLSGFLLLITMVLMGYRVLFLNYPLFPSANVKAWRIVAELYFQPESAGMPVSVQIALPQNRTDQSVIDERFVSGDMGVDLAVEKNTRFGKWLGVITKQEEYIGYEATVVLRQRPGEAAIHSPPVGGLPAEVSASDKEMLDYLVVNFLPPPVDQKIKAIKGIAKGQWGWPPPVREKLAAWAAFRKKFGAARSLIYLSRKAGLPARESTGLILTEGVFSAPVQWLEIWTGKHWEGLKPETGNPYPRDEKMLVLASEGAPVVSVAGGRLKDVRWTLGRQIVSPWRMHLEPALHSGSFLNRWSLFSLPPEFQDTFRIILLVPIGALMICFLRNVIGFPTFGIFMPVLMALAFRNTGPIYGLAIFAGVVFIGYLVRYRINDLRLLLVPRLAAILTLVVICFLVLSLIGNKLGLRNMMAVGLLPFVILTMTIERFYVLIEESGVKEALITAAGSAAVAILTYGVLQLERLQLLFFVYPELLLAVAAFQIMLGRYTGYRLSEYIRFRAFKERA
jgi:hypothetical protein